MLADLPICSRISTDRVELRVSDRTRPTDQPDGQDSRSAQWLPLAVGSRVNTDESVGHSGRMAVWRVEDGVVVRSGWGRGLAGQALFRQQKADSVLDTFQGIGVKCA